MFALGISTRSDRGTGRGREGRVSLVFRGGAEALISLGLSRGVFCGSAVQGWDIGRGQCRLIIILSG